MITSKEVKVQELFANGTSLGLFKQTDTWKGFVELKNLTTGEVCIMAQIPDNIFSSIFQPDAAKAVSIVSASPSLVARISACVPQKRNNEEHF